MDRCPSCCGWDKSTLLSGSKTMKCNNAAVKSFWVELSVVISSVSGLSGCRSSDAIRVWTYNTRISTGDVETCNAWADRRADIVLLFRDMELDVFGIQEVCPSQTDYLRREMPEFAFAGDHSGVDRKSDETSPVFYREDRFVAEKRQVRLSSRSARKTRFVASARAFYIRDIQKGR